MHRVENREPGERPSIVALMTVRNRKASTVACITRLLDGAQHHRIAKIVVVDDGSSDGTSDALQQFGEVVRIISSDGNAYWAGGMRIATQAALEEDADFHLWVNDDADLADDAVDRLLDVFFSQPEERAVVTGVMVDPERETEVSYGGYSRRTRAWYRFDRLPLSDAVQDAVAANGNLLLIPRRTLEAIGGIDPAFTHHYGDWDFTLRASARGIPVLVAPGSHGTTARNPTKGTAADATMSARERWRARIGPKGMPPREELLILRRHALLWPIQFIRNYAGAIVRIFILRR